MLLLSGYSFTASSSSSSFFSVHEQQHQKRENEADFSIHPFNNLPACPPACLCSCVQLPACYMPREMHASGSSSREVSVNISSHAELTIFTYSCKAKRRPK
jgi:hypothetical protein